MKHRNWRLMIGLALLLLMQGCGSNGFQLRDTVTLPVDSRKILLQGVEQIEFYRLLSDNIQEQGGTLVTEPSDADILIRFSEYEEGKRVSGYGNNREVRQYLIFLKMNYQVINASDGKTRYPKTMLNIDKTQIYDSAFVLGKIEEERLIRQELYKDAARQLLLKLRYGSVKENSN